MPQYIYILVIYILYKKHRFDYGTIQELVGSGFALVPFIFKPIDLPRAISKRGRFKLRACVKQTN